jgi:hypothetical protein
MLLTLNAVEDVTLPPVTPDPRLLFAIDKLEQSLVTLRADRHEEALLRTKIEEAIKIGYEFAYSRPGRRRPATAILLGFSDRRSRS